MTVWGCRMTVRNDLSQTKSKSSTQIFDNLWGRESLQVIKDSPKVKCLYRQRGNITDSRCSDWMSFHSCVGKAKKKIFKNGVSRISKPGKKQWKCIFRLYSNGHTLIPYTYFAIQCLTFSLPFKVELNKKIKTLERKIN